ncbi:OmpA family protein [Spongiibacter sp. KMU-158]|uniref:OmpA family protein n=1 Tax=Spongiibacter pelagi TaxID=2760804 RepID=A0A927C161_9GAMM|nr:OmpA family protein [Spongiibacter pelagi]MBD2858834.1 OmpA family protein [Spongiibacter pelagi]
MNRGFWLAGCAAALMASPVIAQDNDKGEAYLFGLATFSEMDEDRGADLDTTGYSLGVGLPISRRLYIEALYIDNTLETNGLYGDFYQTGGGLDLVYSFGDRHDFTPFIMLGGGALKNDVIPDALDDDTMYANIGLGFVGALFDHDYLRYRAEARYIQDDYLDGMSDVRFGIGIEVALGKKDEPAAEPKVVYKTQTIQVEPKDSDNDGIIDSYDDCPNTLAGAKVDGRGCVVQQQTITMDDITFPSNSAELTISAKFVLQKALTFLLKQPNLDAEIAGHTDSTGSDEYNRSLSQRRAESVKNYFVANGIAANRITAKGYGESEPIANNSTKEGRDKNRRVEMRLIPR